jgi:hypothetical protein
MAEQPQPPQDEPKQTTPKGTETPGSKQMTLWDSLMKILRPDKKL